MKTKISIILILSPFPTSNTEKSPPQNPKADLENCDIAPYQRDKNGYIYSLTRPFRRSWKHEVYKLPFCVYLEQGPLFI